MPDRRVPPLLVWTLVVVACVVVLGGSFVYAAQVGDPTVREDALRRPDRFSPRTVTTINGLGNGLGGGSGAGGLGGGGISSGGGSGGGGSGGGTGTFTFSAADFERALPPVSCVGSLQDLAAQDQVSLADATAAWDVVEACAAGQGQPTLPPLALLTSDPLAQQCLAAALGRTTLASRVPGASATSLDRLLQDCQARGALPALPGLGTGSLPPAPAPPPGAGPVMRTSSTTTTTPVTSGVPL